VTVDRLEAIGEMSRVLAAHRLEITGVQTERLEKRRFAVSFDVRRRGGASMVSAVEQIGRIEGVELAGTDAHE
jgi:hypothetical protein